MSCLYVFGKLHITVIIIYVCSSYRYVREWLNGMIAAGFILLDKDSRCYTVPETHKPALSNNIAYSPVAVVMGKRTDLLKKCFKKDGPWGKWFTQGLKYW